MPTRRIELRAEHYHCSVLPLYYVGNYVPVSYTHLITNSISLLQGQSLPADYLVPILLALLLIGISLSSAMAVSYTHLLACNRQFTIFRLWCLGIMLCDLEQGSIYFRFYTDKCLYLLSTCHYRINIFSYLTRIHQYEKTDRNHLYYMRLIFITRFAKERKHCITYS